MRRYGNCGYWFPAAALMAATAFAVSASPGEMMVTKTLGAYKVELHVLPAEAFFTKDEVATKHVQEGMEIEGGAPPVMPDATSHPNHHLVVHVFDKSGRALTDANVTMKFASVGRAGKPKNAPVEVPVVVMQAIGKGPASTHYGNNVTMPAGPYQVTVTVNGKTGVFGVTASDTPSMPMGKMKM